MLLPLSLSLFWPSFPDEDFLHAPSSQRPYAGGESVCGGSDPDTDPEGPASPDHALHLWMQEVKSEHGSGLSSRANSILSLTDTEQERKSDMDNGKTPLLSSHIQVNVHMETYTYIK